MKNMVSRLLYISFDDHVCEGYILESKVDYDFQLFKLGEHNQSLGSCMD